MPIQSKYLTFVSQTKRNDMKEEDVNYVIVQDNGEPLRWTDDKKVVIYGGIEDAELDFQEGDTIVTLGEYAKSIGVDWKTLL